MNFTKSELKLLSTNRGLKHLLLEEKPDFVQVVDLLNYKAKLEQLQAKLIKVQNWVQENEKRVLIIFEGREFAGKGSTLNACIERLNPRAYRKVALNKPNEKERGQWYFKRYIEQIPEKGEMVFFDRSWYNRAVVEPVNGFCTQKEYKRFMGEVNHFEEMLIEDGIIMLKFYLSITKKEQERRIEEVQANPLLRWQLSKVDLEATKLWDTYTKYTKEMIKITDGPKNPWEMIKANNYHAARLRVITLINKKIPEINQGD